MTQQEADLFEASGKTFLMVRPAQELLKHLLDSSLVLVEDWELLPETIRATILKCSDTPALLALLQERDLLTQYQADRIDAGTTHGLILGNYRVLDRLG